MPTHRILRWLTVLLLITCAVIKFFIPVETEDIWWHLKAGQFIATNHQIPHYDPFPFHTEITRWIHLQWLGSLFYYLVYSVDGLAALQITRVVLLLLVVAIFISYALRRVPFVLVVVLSFLLLFPLESRAFLRPFVFNFFFIQIFLISLFQYHQTHRRRWLMLIPLSGLFWVNIHVGSFMYGITLIGIFVFSTVIQDLHHLKKKLTAGQRKYFFSQETEDLAVTLILYPIIFLFTPYGLDGLLHPLKTIFFKDYFHMDKWVWVIAELQPPVYLTSSLFSAWFYLLCAGVVAVLIFDPKDRFLHVLLFAVGLFLFLYSHRAVMFFALVCSYVIVHGLVQMDFSRKWKAFPRAKIFEIAVLWGLVVFLGCKVIHTLNIKVFSEGQTVPYYLTVGEDFDHPRKAVHLLKKNQVEGVVFNDAKYYGYLLWHAYPQLRPFTDNRQVNAAAYLAYLDTHKYPEDIWPVLENFFQMKIVMLDAQGPSQYKLAKYFSDHPDWRLILVDGYCVLFVQKDAFALPPELEHFEESLAAKDKNVPELLAAIEQQMPRRHLVFNPIKEFFGPHYEVVDLEATAITLFNLGYKGAGLEYFQEALTINNDTFARERFAEMKALIEKEKPLFTPR